MMLERDGYILLEIAVRSVPWFIVWAQGYFPRGLYGPDHRGMTRHKFRDLATLPPIAVANDYLTAADAFGFSVTESLRLLKDEW